MSSKRRKKYVLSGNNGRNRSAKKHSNSIGVHRQCIINVMSQSTKQWQKSLKHSRHSSLAKCSGCRMITEKRRYFGGRYSLRNCLSLISSVVAPIVETRNPQCWNSYDVYLNASKLRMHLNWRSTPENAKPVLEDSRRLRNALNESPKPQHSFEPLLTLLECSRLFSRPTLLIREYSS